MKIKRQIQHNIKKKLKRKNIFYMKYSSMILKHKSLNLDIFSNLICDNK
jgi:hypothetical protein